MYFYICNSLFRCDVTMFENDSGACPSCKTLGLAVPEAEVVDVLKRWEINAVTGFYKMEEDEE